MGGAEAGPSNARVQPKVADQLLRGIEPVDATDGRHEACSHCQIDPGDGQQALDGLVLEGILRDVANQHGKVLAKAIQFSDMARIAARGKIFHGTIPSAFIARMCRQSRPSQ